MAGLLVVIGLLGYWAWRQKSNPADSPPALAQAPAGPWEETVPPAEQSPARTGLQRLRRTKATLSEDEIARKSKEVEQRSMEVFMDIFQMIILLPYTNSKVYIHLGFLLFNPQSHLLGPAWVIKSNKRGRCTKHRPRRINS